MLVDGKVVLAKGQLTTVNEADFHAEVADVMRTVDRDYAALVERQAPAILICSKAIRRSRPLRSGFTA